MINALQDVSVAQLKRALEIKEQIEALEQELNDVGGTAAVAQGDGKARGKSTWSAAKRTKMAAMKRAWWARKQRAGGVKPAAKSKRKVSAAVHANLSRAAKKRWAKAKAAGRNRL